MVGSASAAANTPEAIASVADAIGKLVSNSLQISASGAGTALDVLQFISDGGTGRIVNISAAAASSVAEGLSSIASAALSPGSAVSPAVWLNVSNIVSSLAATLLKQLASTVAPGGAPVTVASPLIQISVALDEAGPGSRLFYNSISAPGSNSSFAPLPADIFDKVSGTDAGVRTQFSSLAFDPHTQDVNSTGTTTLAFSTAAGELSISGLSKPVFVTLPLAPLASGLKSQCQFWDRAAGSYSFVGCVSLPDPVPTGHNVTWTDGFNVTTDANMSAAWTISGALVAAPSCCSFEVLDCSLPNNTRAVYPNPARPFDFPAVRCNASLSTGPILAISGSACTLIQEDNTFGCYWSNDKQAFVGAGCVASGKPVQCACRCVATAHPGRMCADGTF